MLQIFKVMKEMLYFYQWLIAEMKMVAHYHLLVSVLNSELS